MRTLSVISLSCFLTNPSLSHAFHSKIPQYRLSEHELKCCSSLATNFRKNGRSTTKPSLGTQLFASLEEDESRKKPPRNNRGRARVLILAIQKVFATLFSTPSRMIVRFRSLSKKGKILMAMQTLTVMLFFGSMARTVYTKHYQMKNGLVAGPPIEVPYSNFLELVEKSGTSTKGVPSPTVDNMRISPERIVYRLTQESSDGTSNGPSRKQLICYTNKIAASPELIDNLYKNNIPFTAANRRRANNLAIAARTAILGFYMLILWRMYKSFSGNASGSGDTPGKLASKSALPLASFNDIQGIDDAKQEVMELVDTLRNPEKYAILGARAPTGLLLEGPPGV